MGNEESSMQQKQDEEESKKANVCIHATSHYQPPTTNSPLSGQRQAPELGWVMISKDKTSDTPSPNKIYPNLPPPYNNNIAQQATGQQMQASKNLQQPNAAPNRFFPQTPQPPQQFFAQSPVSVMHATPSTPEVFYTPPTPRNSATGIWLKGNPKNIPPNAFRAGHDTDGVLIYICRAQHSGDVIPGKLIPSHNCAYISYGGREIPKPEVEILIGDQYRWVAAKNGHVPATAVEGGRTVQGEKLFIGRASHNKSLTPGKIHPSHQCLFIAYGGKEHSYKEYEVLVHLN